MVDKLVPPRSPPHVAVVGGEAACMVDGKGCMVENRDCEVGSRGWVADNTSKEVEVAGIEGDFLQHTPLSHGQLHLPRSFLHTRNSLHLNSSHQKQRQLSQALPVIKPIEPSYFSISICFVVVVDAQKHDGIGSQLTSWWHATVSPFQNGRRSITVALAQNYVDYSQQTKM